MMKKIILIFLLVNLRSTAFNQVIEGTIFDNDTRKPIFSAAIYINGTSVGTLSDKDGNFRLDISRFSSMPLSVSAIGYYSVTLHVFSTGKPNMIYMKPRLFELDEVIVNDKSHARERKTNLATFRQIFLGTTANASNCAITNEDDIRFSNSTDGDTLKAFAIKPILIDNNSLGYKITYFLEKFQYHRPDSTFLFTGEIIFREDSATAERKKMYFERKREKAFFGSRMNFFRALWFEELYSAGFKVKKSAYDTLDYKDIVSQKDSHAKYLKYRGNLGVTYDSDRTESSIIFLKDSILFDPNGYFDAFGIRWEGEMAQQRIADMLPYEYSPAEIPESTDSRNLTEELTEILNQTGKNIPSDQLFLHLDRNLYHAGDTIRFQAYIRDSRTGIITTESSSLYALLLNSDHATIDSARFRIIYSSVSGWLKVPDDISPGDYSILSFSSMDMNYDPEYAFSAPVKIDKIVPDPGERISDGKNEPLQTSPISPGLPQIDLRFLPEGGTFISGIRQRLAFNAVRTNGREVEVSGKIINQRDEKITEFRSTHYGPGVLEFTPVAGDTYFAVIDGKEFREVKWSLPYAKDSGVSMRVDNAGDGMTDIILRERGISEKSWFLTVTLNNVLVFSEDIRLHALYKKRIGTDFLPAGTAYVTLYDSGLNPVAERLVFINDHKKMQVRAYVTSLPVFRGDETELTIQTSDDEGNGVSSVVSVAVIDSATGYYNGMVLPDIESAWLYDRVFYNNLPFEVRSKGLENIESKSVDVLLMTYGWRSFHPKETAIASIEKEVVNYDFLKIINPGPARKTRSDIKLISDGSFDMINLPINEKREAELYYDSLDTAVRQIMIIPDQDPVKNTTPVNILFPENSDYTDNAKLLAPDKSYLNPYIADTVNTRTFYEPGSIIVIEPVTIKAPKQPPKQYEDKYAQMFRYAGTRTMTSEDYREASSFEDILYKSNPFFINVNSWYTQGGEKEIYLRANERITGAHHDDKGKLWVDHQMLAALIVVDGNPIGTSYEMIATMPASEIVSVTFLKGDQGFAIYGSRAAGGVVFVTTKMAAKNIDGTYTEKMGLRDDDLLKQVRLFRSETEYYIPTKEEVNAMPEFQMRPTILWKTDLITDGSGTVRIVYPNNLANGTAMVFVNGVSFTSQVGSKRFSYKVN